jgi:hypothetical protein
VLSSLLNILANSGAGKDTKLHALATLQSLSVDDRIKMLIVEEGGGARTMKFAGSLILDVQASSRK